MLMATSILTNFAAAADSATRKFVAADSSKRRVAIVDEGKHANAIRQALREIGTRFAAKPEDADVLVIGTLSPGPMLDARDMRRVGPRPVIMPWRPAGIHEPEPSLLGPPPVLREAI